MVRKLILASALVLAPFFSTHAFATHHDGVKVKMALEGDGVEDVLVMKKGENLLRILTSDSYMYEFVAVEGDNGFLLKGYTAAGYPAKGSIEEAGDYYVVKVYIEREGKDESVAAGILTKDQLKAVFEQPIAADCDCDPGKCELDND